MAAAYRDRIAYYRKHHQSSPHEAVARTDGIASPEFLESILSRPPEDYVILIFWGTTTS
jgi:hypothetical protein